MQKETILYKKIPHHLKRREKILRCCNQRSNVHRGDSTWTYSRHLLLGRTSTMIYRLGAFAAVMGSLLAINLYEDYNFFIATCVIGAIYIIFGPAIEKFLNTRILFNKSIDVPSRDLHDQRRAKTYPSPIFNTWYHFVDSDALKNGAVMEFRALGRVFALWRDSNGKPVCQDAFCIHQGANLGVGGVVENDCIVCPFHKWKFDSEGTVAEIPYLKDPTGCSGLKNRKQKTYQCMDWNGLLLVYFHADDKEPEFYPPEYVTEEFKKDAWQPHMKWDLGFFTFSPVDWVDQAGDHAHFQTLHADFMIPWTNLRFPDWFYHLIPVGICHTCITYRGDDKEWVEEVKNTGWGAVGKHLLFFTDLAGLTWKAKPMLTTLSPTKEMYIGPAMIVFHIPFTIGECQNHYFY